MYVCPLKSRRTENIIIAVCFPDFLLKIRDESTASIFQNLLKSKVKAKLSVTPKKKRKSGVISSRPFETTVYRENLL